MELSVINFSRKKITKSENNSEQFKDFATVLKHQL